MSERRLRLKETISKDNVIKHKKEAIKKLNSMMEYFINSPSQKHLKKANLLAYWFENFSQYILHEDTYDPRRQIRYNRGDIIKLNFGFNVGKEYGGLHYAIILDKHNDHNSHVVTVIPLTSGQESEAHKKDVYLGTELFNKLNDKYNTLLVNARKKQLEAIELDDKLQHALSLVNNLLNEEIMKNNGNLEVEASDELQAKFNSCKELREKSTKKTEDAKLTVESLERSLTELNKLKVGSIALIGQITTIDKARIYTPRNSRDALYGIRLSDEKMDLINTAVKEQYIF